MRKQDHIKRVERERKMNEEMGKKFNVHDLLHSAFWNKPMRDEMCVVIERVNKQLVSRYINGMKPEIVEIRNLNKQGIRS